MSIPLCWRVTRRRLLPRLRGVSSDTLFFTPHVITKDLALGRSRLTSNVTLRAFDSRTHKVVKREVSHELSVETRVAGASSTALPARHPCPEIGHPRRVRRRHRLCPQVCDSHVEPPPASRSSPNSSATCTDLWGCGSGRPGADLGNRQFHQRPAPGSVLTLVSVLEHHGHLNLPPDVRAQLLALSPATADRLLERARKLGAPRGKSTTRAGTLLKRQIPVRTFADWNEGLPGFIEADLVAHCGEHNTGSFLCTLVLTDVATGWVECQALLYHSSDQVIQGLTRARQLIPFSVQGLDTDNGSEFINNDLLTYCEAKEIPFTRGRTYRKNDQCYVEQKNGAVVRQFVGYDRFEGERAYRQLVELYRAIRLYVNFFQPSLKLKEKRLAGTTTRRSYLPAETPFAWLCASKALTQEALTRLEAIFTALDPVRLLAQIDQLQDALWAQATLPGTLPSTAVTVPFCLDPRASALPEPPPLQRQKRPYHWKAPKKARYWRTRLDPFAIVWAEVEGWLEAQPELTGVTVFQRLRAAYPDDFSEQQVRTLQRRVAGGAPSGS